MRLLQWIFGILTNKTKRREWWIGCPLILMGGGTEVYTPTPQPQPTTAEATEAYIESLPAMYEAQMEYAPQITGQQVGMLEQYLPQVTALEQQLQQQYLPENVAQQVALQQQYAPQLAEQQRELQELYQPEAFAATEALGDVVSSDWMTSYTPEEQAGFQQAKSRVRQDIRGAWGARGLGKSGMSAEDEAMLMAEMEYPYAIQQEQMKLEELGRRQNVGLSMAGMYQVPGQPQIQEQGINIPGLQPANVMQGYSFPQVQSSMQQGYGTYTAGSTPFAYDNTSPWMDVAGGVAGGIGMAMMSSERFKKNIKLWQ